MNTTMNKWYVSIENKAKGPYSDVQMREQIQNGDLKPETLTYKEGEADWLPLDKQDIWTPGFIPKHAVETKDSKDWVLLVESPIKQGDYEQQGPFSRLEVEEKVAIGEVHLKDFCWRPGMEGWKSLVDTHELGFPRKSKITFEDDKKKGGATLKSSDFVEAKTPLKTKGLISTFPDLNSEMPDFVPPEELLQKETENLSPFKAFRTRMLPPLIDKQGERKEIITYLSLVAVLFVGAFYLGSMNSTRILKGVETMGVGLVSLTRQILPATPKVSYVFLRELPLSKGTILVKTDGKPGINIIARVKDQKGQTVRTLSGDKYLLLKANKNGEAFLGISQFKVESGQTYIVTTKAGHLTAKKTYSYSQNNNF